MASSSNWVKPRHNRLALTLRCLRTHAHARTYAHRRSRKLIHSPTALLFFPRGKGTKTRWWRDFQHGFPQFRFCFKHFPFIRSPIPARGRGDSWLCKLLDFVVRLGAHCPFEGRRSAITALNGHGPPFELKWPYVYPPALLPSGVRPLSYSALIIFTFCSKVLLKQHIKIPGFKKYFKYLE